LPWLTTNIMIGKENLSELLKLIFYSNKIKLSSIRLKICQKKSVCSKVTTQYKIKLKICPLFYL
jgi:hypothetical protein